MKKTVLFMLVITMLFSAFVAVNAADEEIHGFSYNSDDYFSTDFVQTSGANVALGTSGWRSLTEEEGKMGRDGNAAFKIEGGKMYLQAWRTNRNSEYSRYAANDGNIAALAYATPSTYLTGNQIIKFSTNRQHATCSPGVRFMVHDGGKSYYAVVLGGQYIQAFEGGSNEVAYRIYKCSNGTISKGKEVLLSSVSTIGRVGEGEYPSFTVTYNNGTISMVIESYNSNGKLARTYTDTWTDSTPFTFEDGETATVWFTSVGNSNASRYSRFENIRIDSLTSETESFDDGTLKYTLYRDYEGNTLKSKYAVVNGFSSSVTQSLSIPAKVTVGEVDYPVTKIANNAFNNSSYNTKNLWYVDASNSALVESGDSAFRGSGVRTVKLPSTLTTISTNVFRGCEYLHTINIPAGVSTLNAGTFYSVMGLSNEAYLNVTFEGSDIAFATTGDAVLSFAQNNKKLKATVNSPAVKDAVAAYCASKGITAEFAIAGTYDDGTLKYATSGNYVGNEVVEAKATITGFSANATAESKKTLTVPATVTVDGIEYAVTKIADGAFRSVGELMYVKAAESSLVEIGESSFRGSQVRTVELPSTLTTIAANAFRGCEYLNTINIPANVTTIKAGTFYSVMGNSNESYLNMTFEGTSIAFEKTGDAAISFASTATGKKVKAIVSHPAVKSAVETYCGTTLGYEIEYVMLYEDGVIKVNAPKTLNEDMFVIALYDEDRLLSADVKYISKNEGESYEYNLAENGIDLSSCVHAKAFLWTSGELTPLTLYLTVK